MEIAVAVRALPRPTTGLRHDDEERSGDHHSHSFRKGATWAAAKKRLPHVMRMLII